MRVNIGRKPPGKAWIWRGQTDTIPDDGLIGKVLNYPDVRTITLELDSGEKLKYTKA